MRTLINPTTIHDYPRFLKIKSLPQYRFIGNTAEFPDEYADLVGGVASTGKDDLPYLPVLGMFDYQRDIAAMAILKRKFAVFADCGLGKTFIATEFARHATRCIRPDQCILIVSPLMVIEQTIAEARQYYGDNEIEIQQVRAADLNEWLEQPPGNRLSQIGITNYEAIRPDVRPGNLAGMILDESSMLKSHYGKHGTKCIELGRGLEWKLCLTGTPAPNDRIEYANHAVFLDAFTSVNAFLATYFVNRGKTDNRWELKPHALRPFYRALSHWSIFLTNPTTYGWKDNCEDIPPIRIHIHDVPLTHEQRDIVSEHTGQLFVTSIGGITSRSFLGQVSKGHYRGQHIRTNKPTFIRKLIDSWPDESTLIWCLYNEEQKSLCKIIPEAASIDGATPHEERQRIIADFKAGKIRILISKPKILGFGLNLQRATRQIFSGLQDSYEQFYQAVKRSNRVGSTRPLNVHIPVTEAERPMIQTVLDKAHRIEQDTREQERIFCNVNKPDQG